MPAAQCHSSRVQGMMIDCYNSVFYDKDTGRHASARPVGWGRGMNRHSENKARNEVSRWVKRVFCI